MGYGVWGMSRGDVAATIMWLSPALLKADNIWGGGGGRGGAGGSGASRGPEYGNKYLAWEHKTGLEIVY